VSERSSHNFFPFGLRAYLRNNSSFSVGQTMQRVAVIARRPQPDEVIQEDTIARWLPKRSGLLRSAVEKLQVANASSSFGRDQTRSAFRWYAVDRGLGLRRATTCHITTDRNHTRKRALKAPLRTSVFTAWSLHKEHTQPAPLWHVSLLGTGSGDPGVLAMTRKFVSAVLARRPPASPRHYEEALGSTKQSRRRS
jgi:hypothetical protein